MGETQLANAKQQRNAADKQAAKARHGGSRDNSPRPARRQTSSTHETNRKGANQPRK